MDSNQEQQHDGKKPEEYKIYKKQWDRQRKAAGKKNKAEGNSERQNMAFFVKLLKSLKLNYKQFAEMTGVSQQLISWWLASDDCKYSNIVSAFKEIGIDIACCYEPLPESNYVIAEDKFSIHIDSLPELGRENDAEQGLVIDQVLAGNGKLRFLAELIDGLKMDLKSFSEEIESNYHVVYSWFKKDDIKISKIYLIADKLQQKVVWQIKKAEKAS